RLQSSRRHYTQLGQLVTIGYSEYGRSGRGTVASGDDALRLGRLRAVFIIAYRDDSLGSVQVARSSCGLGNRRLILRCKADFAH
ncbi:hypothetical protein PENTCL1PPCAC_4146, partial [Pristionchus entomophagus]